MDTALSRLYPWPPGHLWILRLTILPGPEYLRSRAIVAWSEQGDIYVAQTGVCDMAAATRVHLSLPCPVAS